MRRAIPLASLAALIALAACVPLPPAGAVFVESRPPAYRAEVIGVAPGPDFVWIGGYWAWGGADYNWVPGRWIARPYSRAVWVPGRWRSHRHNWYWAEGHWR